MHRNSDYNEAEESVLKEIKNVKNYITRFLVKDVEEIYDHYMIDDPTDADGFEPLLQHKLLYDLKTKKFVNK